LVLAAAVEEEPAPVVVAAELDSSCIARCKRHKNGVITCNWDDKMSKHNAK
jgi:hypothetical protein